MNRNLIPVLFVFPLLLSSCMKYQYMTVHSDLKKTQNGYVAEGDSLSILYRFSGAHCPVQIEVRNNSRHPLYVDWSRSALVVDQQTYSWPNVSELTASSFGSSQYIGYGSHHNLDIHGTITTPGLHGFIPPDAALESAPLTVTKEYRKISKGNIVTLRPVTKKASPVGKRSSVAPPTPGVTVRKSEFSKAMSPFSFRSYLTISRSPDLKDVMTFDHDFWVGSVYQSDYLLENCSCLPDEATTFYVSKATGTGQVLAGIAIIGVVALEVMVPDTEE